MPDYVLVVDAEPDLERQVRAELASIALTIRAASDGVSAHDVLSKHGAPAILVTNLSLPRRDGFALLRGLRRVDPRRSVPAVVVSAFPRMREAADAMRGELGPLYVQNKPLPSGMLEPLLKPPVDKGGRRAGPPSSGKFAVSSLRPPRADEGCRLACIEEMGLVDEASPPDADLQAMVATVAADFGVPIALVSIVLENRQWFKAFTGIDGQLLADRGAPRDWALCDHVVEGRAPLVVSDAREHPVFATNPLVVGGAVIGYAGAPLMTSRGDVLGTLCIIDQQPLGIGPEDVKRLVKAARRVAGELEVRALRRAGPRAGLSTEQAALAYPYLESTLHALDVGVILLDASYTAVLANPAVHRLFGVGNRSIFGKTRAQIVEAFGPAFTHPEEAARRLDVAHAGPWVLHEDIELSKPETRVVRWVGRPAILPDGIGQIISVTDVTSELLFARGQERLARHDVLTGLLNRRGAEEALEREASRAKRLGAPLSIALIDVDLFKRINDSRGHAAGDEVLTRVARAVQSSARAIDAIARWGGDEFLVLLPGTPLVGARAFAERVRAAAELSGDAPGEPVTLSIGVAERRKDEGMDEALARADAALYEAKGLGRNRVAG
ncbi:MAG TPA: diguanylate cyclase [Polyangiaceae bacterium]|jgi:diguanylate cyclase (GGDEF)-like protein